nr:hypothetical protein [Streptomyces sp. A0642]
MHGNLGVLPAAERNLARALFGNGAARASMLPLPSERGQNAFEESIVADLKEAASRYPQDVPRSSRTGTMRSLRCLRPPLGHPDDHHPALDGSHDDLAAGDRGHPARLRRPHRSG